MTIALVKQALARKSILLFVKEVLCEKEGATSVQGVLE